MHPMKKIIFLFTLWLAVSGGRAALPQPDLIAQIHFAGAQKISASANANAFTNEFCSYEALALRANVADKLSVWLAGWLQKNSGVTVAGGAAKLRPLFDDLQKSEWFLEAWAADGHPKIALALKLDPARERIWQENWRSFFPQAVRRKSPGWCFFASDSGAAVLCDELYQKVQTNNAAWLTLDVNWPRLAQWYPDLKQLGLPETQFAVSAPDENLRINGKFFFPENLSLNLEPWRVPTNSLHQPFVSFTAVRGFAPWLVTQPWAQTYKILPAPNQLFVWALPQIPYQTFAAVPFADAADALAQAYARLKPILADTNVQNSLIAPLQLELADNEISMVGVPFVAPFIQATHKAEGQFLLAGAFPNTPRSKPLPPELFQRLAEKNLVFYHWEITAERLPQALNLSQLGLLLTNRRQLEESPVLKWILKISPTLGNTVTQIIQTGPAEMTFTRKAPGIFTAMEMLALGNWLEAPDFPGCDLKLPPRKPFKKNHPHPPAALPVPAPAK